ncbi:MAG TPA: hypothetical protein VF457_13520, partial [Burkholderiaceae bacterium]
MKPTLQRRSLSTRLRIVVLACTLTALVVALGSMVGYELAASRHGWTTSVEAQAGLLARAGASALAAGDEPALS